VSCSADHDDEDDEEDDYGISLHNNLKILKDEVNNRHLTSK
jgi:hypothetical protein